MFFDPLIPVKTGCSTQRICRFAFHGGSFFPSSQRQSLPYSSGIWTASMSARQSGHEAGCMVELPFCNLLTACILDGDLENLFSEGSLSLFKEYQI